MINSFPGYEHIPGPENKGKGRNMYRGIDVGFGGLVYAEPGIYVNVKVFDVSGMHPASIHALNAFGEYTDIFDSIVQLRTFIKHKDFDSAKKMMDGKVAKYLDDENAAKALSQALKIAVNSCYGLTSASFETPMTDSRNVNNIVALRGALFMVNLKEEVQNRGFKVISIKTDSIKVVNPDENIEKFIIEYGKKYGYNFEVENVFERICLINDSTFIAKCADDDPDIPNQWYAKAERFQVPYVFKTLFSKEPLEFKDFCEVKSVKEGDIYLDMNEGLPDVTEEEKQLKKLEDKYKKGELSDTTFEKESIPLVEAIAKGHNYVFVGRVGQFCPIKEGCNGGVMYRYNNGKYYAVTGTKGYRWLESEVVRGLGKEDCIDESYYKRLADEAIDKINEFGDFYHFVDDAPYDCNLWNKQAEEDLPFPLD